MKKVLLCALVAALCLTTGCVKSSADSTVSNDGSATIKMWVAYDLVTFDKFKKAPLDCTCWRVYQIHQDSIPAAHRALDAFESAFDGSKLKANWEKLGLKVSKASVSESDGWKILDVEASAASVADYNAKLAGAMKAAGKDEYLTALPWYLHTRKFLPKLPRFYKTPDPAVVKAVIRVGDVGAEIADLSTLNEETEKRLKQQLTYLRNMRAFDEGQIKVRVKLPGTITSVENAKQEGTDTIAFDLKGPDVDPTTISNQAKVKGLITVQLRVDPKTFKIALEDE